MKKYSKRVWLNPKTSPSTGSIVAYRGPAHWVDPKKVQIPYTFLEIADCQVKVRLHMTKTDSHRDFINKLEKLGNTALEFAEFLKKI